MISGRMFDLYWSRFTQQLNEKKISFSCNYGFKSSNPSLLIRIECNNSDSMGELCVWESGDCNMSLYVHENEDIQYKYDKIESDQDLYSHVEYLYNCIVNGTGNLNRFL